MYEIIQVLVSRQGKTFGLCWICFVKRKKQYVRVYIVQHRLWSTSHKGSMKSKKKSQGLANANKLEHNQ